MIQDFAAAGADFITFHPEATTHIDRSLQLVRAAGCKSGLVFNPSTSLDILKYVLDKVNIILLMSVNPGFGGQSFIPGTLDKAQAGVRPSSRHGRRRTENFEEEFEHGESSGGAQ